MTDKQIIIKRIRDCDNCKFKPETSKVCEIYDNCYLVSEHIVNLREQLRNKEQECEELKEQLAEMILQSALLPKFFGLTADEITNMLNQLDQLKAENNLLRQTHKTEQDRRRAYENALTEIKEIVFPKNQLIITDSPIILKIQEKISECEGNDELTK